MSAVRRCLFLLSMPMVYISFALPLQAKAMGASAFAIGGLFSVFTISLVVVRPLVGIGLDRFGRRPFFLMALVVYTLANALFSLGPGMEAMYLARLLQGLAVSLLLITTATITTDLTGAGERARAMGFNVQSQARGMLAGAFLGFSLVASAPTTAWRTSFAAYALCALIALLYALRALPETRATRPGTSGSAFSLAIPPAMRRLMLVVFVSGFTNAMVAPIYLIYLSDRFEAGMLLLAWAFLPSGIVYATLPPRLGHLSDRWGRANILALGLAIAGCLYLALPHLPNLLWIALVYTIGHVGWAMAEPARTAWIGDLSPGDSIGRTFGVGEFCLAVGATLGPLLGGLIYDHISRDVVFHVSGAILVATSALILVALREPREGEGAPTA